MVVCWAVVWEAVDNMVVQGGMEGMRVVMVGMEGMEVVATAVLEGRAETVVVAEVVEAVCVRKEYIARHLVPTNRNGCLSVCALHSRRSQ